jgi:hypothetical protein
MKKLIPFVLSFMCILFIKTTNAQCPYDNLLYLEGDAPTQVGYSVLAPECWGGDIIRLDNCTAGYTYIISTCGTPTFDSQITIYPAGGGNSIAFDDDGCGDYGGPSALAFVCPANGDYDILLDEYPCTSNYTNMDMTIELYSTNGGGGNTGVTIPMVVHVLYNANEENISDAQILSQVDELNKDYSKLNDNFESVVPDAFKAVAASCNIQFCLASTDPNGAPTTGITRTFTNTTQFQQDDAVKHSATGGHDNWDPTRYLNIWVCNLGGGLLGYATFPADLQADPSNDGVVILYKAFGNTGVLFPPYDLGRTATHEIGHWLNLRHIWGDANCGDDFVEDTPTQQDANNGCPTFPHVTCNNGANGDMFMNFMDYTDDACMALFTNGQNTRIEATLNGSRAGLLNSGACTVSTAVPEIAGNGSIALYPNPNNGQFTVQIPSAGFVNPDVYVFDRIGKNLGGVQVTDVTPNSINLKLNNHPAGVYFVTIAEGDKHWKASFIVE